MLFRISDLRVASRSAIFVSKDHGGDAWKLVQEAQRTEYRIGINIGDVLVEGDDIYGDGVNVAARLEGLAVANKRRSGAHSVLWILPHFIVSLSEKGDSPWSVDSPQFWSPMLLATAA